jgi:hypothetical protein
MKVDSLRLKQFSVFEDVELVFSPGINVFLGTNGTGKSHAMKALYAPLKTMEEDRPEVTGGFPPLVYQTSSSAYSSPPMVSTVASPASSIGGPRVQPRSRSPPASCAPTSAWTPTVPSAPT